MAKEQRQQRNAGVSPLRRAMRLRDFGRDDDSRGVRGLVEMTIQGCGVFEALGSGGIDDCDNRKSNGNCDNGKSDGNSND